MLLFPTTNRHSLHRHEGLTRYLANPLKRPVAPTSTSSAAIERYNAARLAYISGGITLNTPDVITAKKTLVDCFAQNHSRNSGHAGLMLSGNSTVGKTTAAKALMSYAFNQHEKQRPGAIAEGSIPVVYVEVPAGSTAKLLMRTFADFFGLTVKASESMGSIRTRVVDTMNAVGTVMVVVDELHNLATRSIGNGESVDLLKGLHNDLAATFVYAGIDLDSGNLLAGPRGQQLSARFTLQKMHPFNISEPGAVGQWHGLLNAFHHDLLLADQTPGALIDLSDYLYERTSGSLGSLSRLLTTAAMRAITSGEKETITMAGLEDLASDHTAELKRSEGKRISDLAHVAAGYNYADLS